MSIQNRLSKLETAYAPAPGGVCNCAPFETRVYYPGNEPPADMPPVSMCDVCGGEIRVVKIQVVYTDEGVAA